jgi:hypothetical protein
MSKEIPAVTGWYKNLSEGVMELKSVVEVADEFINLDMDEEEGEEVPVVIPVDSNLIRRILTMNRDAIRGGYHAVSIFEYSPLWQHLTIDMQEIRTDCSMLYVGKWDFWWTCYLKYNNVKLATQAFDIEQLK